MCRWISMVVLPALLILASAAPVEAQWPGRVPAPGWRSWRGQDISGRYISQPNRSLCYVYRQDDGYEFVNDSGSRALFVYTAPGRLEQVAGEWDPSVVATVTRNRWGRIVLQFDSPNAPPGYWVSAD
jgi:hypothetical protein